MAAPLEESLIQDISTLYGEFNPKYRDAKVCHRVFNENPHGGGVHAFVVNDRGERIGHYGIVPMAIRMAGQRRISGKGEAFVVRPDCRDAVVQIGGDPPLAISLALTLSLYPFAADHRLYPIHMLAPPEVAPLHRLSGCRTITLSQQRYGVLLRPDGAPSGSRTGWRESLLQPLVLGRAAALRSWAAVVGLGSGPSSRWTAGPARAEHFERVVETWSVGPGWGLDLDVPTLQWFASWSSLDWIQLSDGAGHALVCSRSGNGQGLEVMHLHTEQPGVESLARLLAAVLIHAYRTGRVGVGCSDHAVRSDAARSDLARAARLLGLRARDRQPRFLVYTHEPESPMPHDLEFSPIFHAAF